MKKHASATIVRVRVVMVAVVALAGLGGPTPDASADTGRTVYRRACAACHGNAGDGQGSAARYLEPRPRDFTLGFYKFKSTPIGLPPADADLRRTVTRGIPTTSMPPFGDLLAEEEVSAVVAYIKTFSDNFALAAVADPVAIPAPPEMTARATADGKNIYMMTGCWTCHGPRGRGEGDAATVLKDASGFEVRPVDFTKGRYKAGNEPEDIYRSIESGFIGTPMPGFAAAFSFGSDSATLPSTLSSEFTQDEIAAARAYIDAQPTRAEIDAMSAVDRAQLVATRKWALVFFLQSLAEETSVWQRLFLADTEVTP